jgi:hypothetical protein
MLLRIVAALPLGYAVATLWAMATARMLPIDASQATTTGMLAAFVICPFAAIWAFAARSGWRAVWVLALAGALAGGITWLSIATGGRL